METGKKKQIQNFTDLFAWQEGHKLVLMIYKITRQFPHEEQFGLISQMRRCAVSITSNIAEGFGRQSLKEKVQFYCISRGSTTELQNQLLVSRDVGFIIETTYNEILEQLLRVHKIINALISKTRTLKQFRPVSSFQFPVS